MNTIQSIGGYLRLGVLPGLTEGSSSSALLICAMASEEFPSAAGTRRFTFASHRDASVLPAVGAAAGQCHRGNHDHLQRSVIPALLRRRNGCN